MTALNHMTDEDLKAMGIPMVRINLPSLGFVYFILFSSVISCSSIGIVTHVQYGTGPLTFNGAIVSASLNDI